MPGLFEDYRVALLDASFFACKFSERLKQGLENIKVYIADTFLAEVEQYKSVLPVTVRDAYEENLLFLNSTKQLNTLNLESFGDMGKGVHNDTWGLLTLLVGLEAKFVLITADQLLIQRAVLHDMAVDIFDLNQNAFIRPENFPAYRENFELKTNENQVNLITEEHHTTENSVLFRRNNSSVVLGKKVNSGLEANLYMAADNPGLIVKVFKKGKLSEAKYNNILRIQNINQRLAIPWALFPREVVFYDAKCTVPAGFTEDMAATKGNLDDNPLYLGDVDLPDEYLNTRLSYSLELCLKVVNQVRYLNSYGFLVSDFNMGNFAFQQFDTRYIQMWDTDSFGYGPFFSGYCAGNQTSRAYDTTKKTGVIDFCSEALYLFAFSVLSLGDLPISEFNGKFKYDKPGYGALYRKDLFPRNLWRLFEAVFRGEEEPSVAILQKELHTALKVRRLDSAMDKTYKELLGDIMQEYEEDEDPPGGEIRPDGGGSDGGPTDEKMPRWLKAVLAVAAGGFVLFLLSVL